MQSDGRGAEFSRRLAQIESRQPIATGRRHLAVTLTRYYETWLDWRHLVTVFSPALTACECARSGAWGWALRLFDHSGRIHGLHLQLDREAARCWVSMTEGPWLDSVWVCRVQAAVANGCGLDLEWRFHGPVVGSTEAPAENEQNAMVHAIVDQVLATEEQRMQVRERHLNVRIDMIDRDSRLDLGAVDVVVVPQTFTLSDREYVLTRLHDEWIAYPAWCPHMLAPLASATLVGNVVRCPWHGAVFNVVTGACEHEGALAGPLALGPQPHIVERAGHLWAEWP